MVPTFMHCILWMLWSLNSKILNQINPIRMKKAWPSCVIFVCIDPSHNRGYLLTFYRTLTEWISMESCWEVSCSHAWLCHHWWHPLPACCTETFDSSPGRQWGHVSHCCQLSQFVAAFNDMWPLNFKIGLMFEIFHFLICWHPPAMKNKKLTKRLYSWNPPSFWLCWVTLLCFLRLLVWWKQCNWSVVQLLWKQSLFSHFKAVVNHWW